MRGLFDNDRHGRLSCRLWNLMAEIMLQISSLSFQYECSKIKLNLLKLYNHLLGVFWNLFSFLFSFVIGFSYHVGGRIRVLLQIRPSLIIVSFLKDESFLWVFVKRGSIPWSAEFIQVISFFFSLRSLRGIILEFGFLLYPKKCSWFFNE